MQKSTTATPLKVSLGIVRALLGVTLLLGMPFAYADEESIGRATAATAVGAPREGSSRGLPPEQVHVVTPRYQPHFESFDPPLGRYTYEISWGGIPAAEATVEVNQAGEVYTLTATAHTYSAIDLFYRLRYKAEGIISAIDLRPESTRITHLENSKIRSLDMKFHSNGLIEAVRTSQRQGKERKVVEHVFNPNNFTLDPFSASFLARSLEWREGETKEFDTFNGQTRYLIRLTAEAKRVVPVRGEIREVWVIVPSVVNLSTNKPHEKLRRAEILVTADSRREIVEITSEVFVGSVSTTLESFEPLPQPSPEARLALQRVRETALSNQG